MSKSTFLGDLEPSAVHESATTHSRVAVVGSGFAGIAVAVGLKKQGIEDFVLFERASDVGGTWQANTYPGCQCDVPSHLYSFSFAPNPEWSRTYSLQPEIGRYIRATAEDFDVVPHVRFDTALQDARWDGDAQRWVLETSAGTHTCDVLVMGNGPLSEPKLPDVPGLDTFEGTTFHSARWDHDHDLTGERVAVIGTGASAIQLVPQIQPTVGELLVVQRTPPWVLPHGDRPIRSWERALYRRFPLLQKAVRYGVYWMRELGMFGFARNPKIMNRLKAIGLRHMRKAIDDPVLREKLTPSYTPGCKRLLPSNKWYPALAQENVTVVADGIVEVTPKGVVTGDGTEHVVDTIIFGTGFHVTDNPAMAHVRGADGRTLAEVFAESGMRQYKGTAMPGFPNLFFLAGANTGIGHTSLLVMIEAQVRYVLDALRHLDRTGAATVECRPRALDRWNEKVQRKLEGTVWNTGGCQSWYLDDHGRNPTLWPDFTWKFVLETRRFDPDAYVVSAPARTPVTSKA